MKRIKPRKRSLPSTTAAADVSFSEEGSTIHSQCRRDNEIRFLCGDVMSVCFSNDDGSRDGSKVSWNDVSFREDVEERQYTGKGPTGRSRFLRHRMVLVMTSVLLFIVHSLTVIPMVCAFGSVGGSYDRNQVTWNLGRSRSGRRKLMTTTRLHFGDAYDAKIEESSSSRDAVVLPPWLDGISSSSKGSNTKTLGNSRRREELKRTAERNVIILKSYMEYLQRYEEDEIDDVLLSLSLASNGDLEKLAGAADFLWLLLSIDHDDSSSDSSNELSPISILFDRDGIAGTEPRAANMMMTRDVLIASSFHYCECVSARRSGIYEIIEDAVKISPPSKSRVLPSGSTEKLQNYLPFRSKRELNSANAENIVLDVQEVARSGGEPFLRDSIVPNEIERHFGPEASRIATSTSQIKRVEVIADVVVGKGDVVPLRSNAMNMHNLLLSVSDDWQALAIRSVASLYRLRGIIAFRDKYENTLPADAKIESLRRPLATEEVRLTREALTVYAPIAQRLGMQRLKNEIEGKAFRLLYPRQHLAAMSIYEASASKMINIANDLKKEIELMLGSDEIVSRQAKCVNITCRIKEPYSLWRKLLKLRLQGRKRPNAPVLTSPTFSILDVQDAIALRIIVTPVDAEDHESEEITQTKEKLLCYYIQKKCCERWPVYDSSRKKDYIANPKANGYQSLHHTSHFFRYGIDWPFEVQIRSASMHKLAEFGVASHWDYKLRSKGITDAIELSSKRSSQQYKLLPKANGDEEVTESIDVSRNNLDLKEAKARAQRLAPYLDALTEARDEIKDNLLYVFISPSCNRLDGKILPISVGSSVYDIICEHGSDSCSDSFQLNGVQAMLEDSKLMSLQNGDVITLPVCPK